MTSGPFDMLWLYFGVPVAVLLASLLYYLARERRKLIDAQRIAEVQKKHLEELTIAAQRLVTPKSELPGVADVGAQKSGPQRLPPVEDSLVEALVSGTCVLFAGSGVSAQAGFPVWQQTLSAVIGRFESRSSERSWDQVRQKLTEGRIDVVADLISSRVQRSDLLSFFAETYGRPVPDLPPLCTLLADLPFARVLTANWDRVIDATFARRSGEILAPSGSDRFAAAFRENAFLILKLYGQLENPPGVSFSAEEYRRAIEDNPEFFKFVSTTYSSNTLLFLGVSLPGIEDFVSALRLRGDPTRTHYALVPWQPDIEVEMERFQGRYGIRLLPFHPTAGFTELFEWTRNLTQRFREQAAISPPPKAAIRQQAITRLQLENIGSFPAFDQVLDPGWNLLLGNNGLGKSTLLRAVAMAFCGNDPKAARAAATLLRAGARTGAIRIWLGEDRYESRLIRDGAEVRVECDRYTPFQSGTIVAFGFPPLRGVSLRNPSGPRQVSAPNPMIDDVLPLLLGSIDSRVDTLKQWLVNVQTRIDSTSGSILDRERARQMRGTFFRIMDELSPGLEVSFDHVDTRTFQVMVLTQDGVIPIDQLSQGMTSLLGWVGALLERMYEIHSSSPEPEKEPGLLLVDEIAAHMHPEWEYAMVPLIRKNFEKLQVIATTHSPLVVANSRPGEVFHLRRHRSGVKIERLSMSFEGLRADQVLTGPAFGLETTLDPKTRELRDEYTKLLGMNRDAPQEQRFQDVARQLALKIPKPQEREEARQAVEMLETWMTERFKAKPLEERQKVVREAELYLSQLDGGDDIPLDAPADSAFRTYREALAGFRAVKDGRGELSTLRAIADLQGSRGEFEAAGENYQKAIEIARALHDPVAEGWSWRGLGDAARDLGRIGEAVKSYDRAFGIFQRIGDEDNAAWLLKRMGDVRFQSGETEDGNEKWGAALEIFTKLNDESGMGSILKSQGDLLFRRGNRDAALENYTRALALATSSGDRTLQASALRASGDARRYRGELAEARDAYEKALAISRDLNDPRQIAWSLKVLGDLERREAPTPNPRSA
jgi:tetratricopeptide (TPR) repeat protein